MGTKRRWDKHVSDAKRGSAFAFHCAIRKHGANAFTHRLLERLSTQAGALRAEMLWIRELKSFAPSGYNTTMGGDGMTGYRYSQASRAKMAESHRGRSNGPFTPEHRSKISAKLKGIVRARGEQHYGSKLTEVQVAEMRALFRQPHYHGKYRAIARQFGIAEGTVHNIKSGRQWRHVK